MRMQIMAVCLGIWLAGGPAFAGGDPQAGKQTAERCAACHGADGNSPTAQYPILAGQYADYLVQAMREYRSGARDNAIMKGMVAGLSEQDMEDLAAWFASQPNGVRQVRSER